MTADAQQIAEQFPRALQRMEQSRDPAELAGFFAEDAQLSNLGAAHDLRGAEGVQQFWRSYLDRFSEIRSEFSNAIVAERAVMLEWHSDGTQPDGQPISYRGVSILVLGEGGKVSEFRTYYDSAAFVAKVAKVAEMQGS